MVSEIPELVFRSAERSLRQFCATPLRRSGHEYLVFMMLCPGGFELMISRFDQVRKVAFARLQFSPELGQWTLHRPRPGNRWSYVPEAGGSLDLNVLLRYLKSDPLNIFWE